MAINIVRLDRQSPRSSTSSAEQPQQQLGESGNADSTNGRASPTGIFNPYYTGRPRTPANSSRTTMIDRQEIIRRIKSRESRPTSPELERQESETGRKRRSLTPLSASMTLPERPPQDNQSIGTQIERPRSALHRGDFREKELSGSAFERLGDAGRPGTLSTSPVAPWHADFPAAVFRQVREERHQRYVPPAPPGLPIQRPARSRAVSHASLAAAFVYKPPTSPLVQSSRPDTPEPRQRSRSPDKSRRHTFSPPPLRHFQSSLEYPSNARSEGKIPPPLRAERTFPYQAHQPRRSLHSFGSLPHSPAAGSRRPSFSDSPLHHAPMVGSYEESILRGRMSTTPSKPLNFVAQIGVLGKGDCKANLRCPPHATVPFPAVFYSYSGTKAVPTDQPSPYVGLVDLENNLSGQETTAIERRHQRVQATLSGEGSRANSGTREDGSASDAQTRRRRRQKQKRRSGSPKAPPGGSYRVPQRGQLQIIIKNPNKTAVKLFLIPYDLSDMESGQKTFLRQRSYSAGPIIDMPLSSRTNLGTDRPEAALSVSDDPNERPILRYLIHLHICCPAKGRYFLYKSIRVVFANRVPDGKEKLRNEIQLPEPRYTTYNPTRDSIGLGPALRDSMRRRASNVDLDESLNCDPLRTSPSLRYPQHYISLAQSLPLTEYNSQSQHILNLPMQTLPRLPNLDPRPSSRQNSESTMDVDSEQNSRSAFSSPTSAGDGSFAGGETGFAHFAGVDMTDDQWNFGREESRWRGLGSASGSGGGNESLLSRRLRDLAFLARPPGNGDGGDME